MLKSCYVASLWNYVKLQSIRRALNTQHVMHSELRVSEGLERNVNHRTVLVRTQEALRFANECLMRVGVPLCKSRCIADAMIAADNRGMYGCGLYCLEMYIYEIYKKYINIFAEPEVLLDTVCLAHVTGNNAAGVLVGNFCMDLAIAKARDCGVGIVVARDSNYYGMGAWYVYRALQHNLIGITMTNASPMMLAPGAMRAHIGANGLSIGAKGSTEHIMLDMATTVKDFGSIEFAFMSRNDIPLGWATDECGRTTRFSSLAASSQTLFPAGNHKGYCLAAMIDLLCGVMSGANFATQIQRWQLECRNGSANLGQLYIAIDPEYFVSDFSKRLDDFIYRLRNCEPANPKQPVMVPGDPEKNYMLYVDTLHAIPYPKAILEKYRTTSKLLCVEPISTKC